MLACEHRQTSRRRLFPPKILFSGDKQQLTTASLCLPHQYRQVQQRSRQGLWSVKDQGFS